MTKRTLLIDYDGWPRNWVLAIGLALVFLACGTVIWGIAWHADHVRCLRLHEQTGYDTHMAGSPMGGECYVHIGPRWIPADQYRNTDVNQMYE